MVTKKKTALELAQEQWTWIQSLLEIQQQTNLQLQRKLFIDAFVHGYKYAKDERVKAVRPSKQKVMRI